MALLNGMIWQQLNLTNNFKKCMKFWICFEISCNCSILFMLNKYILIKQMIKKYRKKPVIIEAIQWNGKNLTEIDNFVGGSLKIEGSSLVIHTLEGDMEASINDYIIKGVNGEFYPCKPDIFDKTYESAQ